jgi:hypothetical protein
MDDPFSHVGGICQADHPLFPGQSHILHETLKISIASIVGGLVGLLVGSGTTIVALPIVVTIGICFAATMTLDMLDRHFGLTEKLVTAITQKKEEMEKSLGRKIYKFERELIYNFYDVDINHIGKHPSL